MEGIELNSHLFLTTASLSTNPRLVKELYLIKQNSRVAVIAISIGDWTIEQDKKILNKLGAAAIKLIPAIRTPFLPWFFATIAQQVAILLSRFIKSSLFINSLAHNKRTILILFHLVFNLKKYRNSLIICHTLGALYPGYILAKQSNAKLAFDMEDYHPGELISGKYDDEKRRREYILKRILPECSYVSFAADGFYELTKNNLTHDIKKPLIVYNSFPSVEFIEPTQTENNKIKFVWFSQTIGRGRGLELFFDAAKSVDFDYEVTLIGSFNDEEFESELKQNKNLKLFNPLPQKELHHKLSENDIGLSLELNSTDLNRNHALTNKLFAYLQAGLFVLATDTPAQKGFMNNNPGFGVLCGQTSDDILNGIIQIRNNIAEVRRNSIPRFNEAKKFAWENESKKLIELWDKM